MFAHDGTHRRMLAAVLAFAVPAFLLTACNDDPLITEVVNGPVANAGADQTVEDVDGSGDEVVLLDGSGSTAGDAAIATYAWSEGGVDIVGATVDGGRTLSAGFDVGVHDVLLTVTDAAGLSDTDNVSITVEAQAAVPPTVTITNPADMSEFDVGADVVFSGSAVDKDLNVIDGADLEWSSDVDGVLGTGTDLTVNTLSEGDHTITLTATDGDGVDGTASITVTVNPVIAAVSFANDILPYFNGTCNGCHGAGASGEIRLDSYTEVSTGGNANGPLIVAGNSADATAILLPKVEADHNNGPDDAAFAVELAQWIDDGADDN